MKHTSLSLISLNAMSARNFDSLHGLLISGKSRKRQEKIADVLGAKNPDFLLLQEVHTYPTVKLLQSKLSAYPFVIYQPYLYGPRGGLVIFSKLPLTLVEYVNFRKRGTFLNGSFIGHIIKNGILVCKLQNLPLYLLNTHLTPNMDHDWSKNNRFMPYIEAQFEQIGNVIQKLSRKKDVLIAGDFNTAKDSYLYRDFLRQTRIKDLFSKFDFPTQHKEYLPKSKPNKRMDYIFLHATQTTPKILHTDHLLTHKITMSDGNKQYLSDHIALLASLAFPIKKENDTV